MKKTFFEGFKAVIGIILTAALVLSLAACGGKEKKEEYKKIGEGTENDFYLEIEKDEETTTKYHVFTDVVSIGQALEEIGFIKYAETDKGEIYVSTVDGKKVDFEKDKEYWAIYSGSNYLSSNPAEIAIECASIYTFKIVSLNSAGVKFPESKPEYSTNDDENEEETESAEASSSETASTESN